MCILNPPTRNKLQRKVNFQAESFESSLLCYSTVAGREGDGFMPFPKASTRTVSSRMPRSSQNTKIIIIGRITYPEFTSEFLPFF